MKIRVVVLTGFGLLTSFSADRADAQPAKQAVAGTAKKVGEHHEVRVVAVRTAKEWSMFPGMAGMPTMTPKAGDMLVIVEFAAKDVRTGKDDRNASFSGFEVQDSSAKATKSPLESTDVREIPFSVPDPTMLRVFRIGGVSFDIEAMAKSIAKPGESNIQVISAEDVSEYNVVASRVTFRPAKDSRLFLVKIKATPKMEEVAAVVIDASNHRYKTIFHQVAELEGGITKAEMLFEVPSTATLRVVEINGKPVNLPKTK